MLRAENSMNVIMGQLQLPTQGGAGGVLIGIDALLYRKDANGLWIGTGDSLTLPTTSKLYFRDTGISISSKDDGHLDLDADISIDLNSSIVEVDTFIVHAGDPDTMITFGIDEISLKAGNVKMINFSATTLAFFAATLTAQAAHLADPTDEASLITAVSTLIDELKAYGLMAADP